MQGDRLFSQAHDELYQLNFERQRWGPLALRPPKRDKKQEVVAAASAQPAASDGAADEVAAAAVAVEVRQPDGSSEAQPSGVQAEKQAEDSHSWALFTMPRACILIACTPTCLLVGGGVFAMVNPCPAPTCRGGQQRGGRAGEGGHAAGHGGLSTAWPPGCRFRGEGAC